MFRCYLVYCVGVVLICSIILKPNDLKTNIVLEVITLVLIVVKVMEVVVAEVVTKSLKYLCAKKLVHVHFIK